MSNIEFHLIDRRSPQGFTFVVPADRRVMIEPTDDMSAVVQKMVRRLGNHRIHVLRIEAHGTITGIGTVVNTIQFGSAMNVATVSAFQRIRPLMSSSYSGPPTGGINYRTVHPRIEMHCCQLVPLCNPILQALANAVHVPLFASSAPQDVDARSRHAAYRIEPPVTRFEPGP
jgi:hypothetical protein